MKNKHFLHIQLFTLAFMFYSILMWLLNVELYVQWFLGYNVDEGIKLLIAVSVVAFSNVVGWVYKTQTRLFLNGADEKVDANENRASVWTAILLPLHFLLAGSIFNFFI